MVRRFQHGGDTFGLPGVLDFSASLNPLGMPEVARKAYVECIDACSSYPDPYCRDLTDAIAEAEELEPGLVVPCAGATDAFTRICLAFRPRRAMVCAPSYVGYEQVLSQCGAAVAYAPLHEEECFAAGPSVTDALDDTVELLFVAHPNNPSGRCAQPEELERLLRRAQRCGTIVVLDECFIDLTDCEDAMKDLLGDYRNLIIVKALTKTYALAGLRVGYALCSDAPTVARLEEMGQAWSVSVPAQAVGAACLRDTSDYLDRSRKLIKDERRRLEKALAGAGMAVVPSDANFLLWKARTDLTPQLLEQGILVRSCANFVGLDGRWHRSAVRKAQDNDAFIEALRRVAP